MSNKNRGGRSAPAAALAAIKPIPAVGAATAAAAAAASAVLAEQQSGLSPEAPAVPNVPTVADIVAGLLRSGEFGDLVALKLPTAAEMVPAILAEEDFVTGLKSLVDSHLDASLPELVAAAMPVETAIEITHKAANVVDLPIARTAKAEKAAAAAAARAAEELAEERAARKEEARGSFVALIETVPDEIEPIDLTIVQRAALAFDDGSAFSIDLKRDVPIGDLSLDDNGAVRLRHGAIDLGDGLNEPFVIKGVVLILQGEEGMRAARCEMPALLMVGAGQRAQLSPDSLIFRIPR